MSQMLFVASFLDPCYNRPMTTQTLEGTWEEVAQHANALSGRRVRVTIIEEEAPQPNKAMLAALHKVAERSQNMPVSSGAETLKILREGRNGRMFGYDPTE